jgi:hypothetical protein
VGSGAVALSPVRMATFEFGNLGADVVAALDQQIVVRDLLLRPRPGVGAEGRKILHASLDHGQLSVQPIELRGLIHYCSPELKKAQRGVGPSEGSDTIRHVKLHFTPEAA